jgi:hypothetical protein
VEVIAHDNLTINLQAFFILAELNALYYYVGVFPAGKYIDPLHNSAGNEVSGLLIGYFIGKSHGVLLFDCIKVIVEFRSYRGLILFIICEYGCGFLTLVHCDFYLNYQRAWD